MTRIVILCSDPAHPVNAWLERWIAEMGGRAEISLVRRVEEVGSGDFLFLIACHQIVRQDVRDRFRFVLVVHASALPKGRGWSPLVWQILAGAREIPVTLLNAEEGVDTGDIWRTEMVRFEGTELHDEMNEAVSRATMALMTWAVANCQTSAPRVQEGEADYFPRRRPADSEVRPDQSIAEIFDLLRISDPARYPVFFEMRGQRYLLRLDKAEG